MALCFLEWKVVVLVSTSGCLPTGCRSTWCWLLGGYLGLLLLVQLAPVFFCYQILFTIDPWIQLGMVHTSAIKNDSWVTQNRITRGIPIFSIVCVYLNVIPCGAILENAPKILWFNLQCDLAPQSTQTTSKMPSKSHESCTRYLSCKSSQNCIRAMWTEPTNISLECGKNPENPHESHTNPTQPQEDHTNSKQRANKLHTNKMQVVA